MGAWHMSDEVNDVRINYFCHFTMHVFSLNIAYTKIPAVYFVYFLPYEQRPVQNWMSLPIWQKISICLRIPSFTLGARDVI